jgi:deferrochelatase/peroxidase EfeB
LVNPDHVGGVKMLRRGYNFTDGSDGFGHLDAGLFFIAFVRSPSTNFIPVLAQMSGDALNEYIFHTGTGVFACPPGLREGDSSAYWGSTLFS